MDSWLLTSANVRETFSLPELLCDLRLLRTLLFGLLHAFNGLFQMVIVENGKTGKGKNIAGKTSLDWWVSITFADILRNVLCATSRNIKYNKDLILLCLFLKQHRVPTHTCLSSLWLKIFDTKSNLRSTAGSFTFAKQSYIPSFRCILSYNERIITLFLCSASVDIFNDRGGVLSNGSSRRSVL